MPSTTPSTPPSLTPSDFTDPRVFLSYMGSFWSQVFQPQPAILGLAQADSQQLIQVYQDFLDQINATSVFTMPSVRRELVRPIVINQSQISTSNQEIVFGGQQLAFGEPLSNEVQGVDPTQRYGGQQQARIPWFVAQGPSLLNTGTVIVNRLVNPSLTLVRGSDFVYENNNIVFQQNPFANSLIPQRTVANPAAPGGVDQQIVLWALNCEVNDLRVHQQYGYIFFNTPDPSPSLELLVVQRLFRIYAGGPTVGAIDSLICAVAGGAQTVEAQETVQFISESLGQQIVATDCGVYAIPATDSLRTTVVPGAVLPAGSPLTTRTQVFDSVTTPLWWTSLPGITLRDDYCVFDISNVTFPNADVAVDAHGHFYLAGAAPDIQKFWNQVDARCIAQGVSLPEMLWTDAGIPADKPLVVNPLHLLAERISGMSWIVVTISSVEFPQVESALAALRQTLPVTTALLVVLRADVCDAQDFTNPEGLVQLDSPTRDGSDQGYLRAFLANRMTALPTAVQDQWGATDVVTAEALCDSISPEILTDSLELDTCVSEDIVGTNIPVCTL